MRVSFSPKLLNIAGPIAGGLALYVALTTLGIFEWLEGGTAPVAAASGNGLVQAVAAINVLIAVAAAAIVNRTRQPQRDKRANS